MTGERFMDKLWQFWKEKKNQKKTKTTNGLVGGLKNLRLCIYLKSVSYKT